jgi:hypothetical protein
MSSQASWTFKVAYSKDATACGEIRFLCCTQYGSFNAHDVCIYLIGVADMQIVVVLPKKKYCIYYYGICLVSSIDV